ncbi:MAG: precorrin-6A/cobalt-precorrin-6A reductase [Rhodospirillum sp.]|nr:precorrin-6A/cobalt-precorrin-6A reductase [Rhodospirillum sp.]MCF8491657.1 precorrin-6A/cobalt-precorrin-6A reductase [Rhodospirillum sp.]MCF8501363.1 precorrin-6A/cobalt-precorrin-6A reductase [Rhodospirillum sp.]
MSRKIFILILGGTPEAYDLTIKLQLKFTCLYSLAGVAPTRRPPPANHRIGGFGGVEGLIDFLRETGVTHLIDGTHPFATTMTYHARVACDALDIPRLIFQRPAWIPSLEDRWIHRRTVEEAAMSFPAAGNRPFLALGRRDADIFARIPGLSPILRLIQGEAPSPNWTLVHGRGPFTAMEETTLLDRLGADSLVCKNSGGSSGAAKLDAARTLGLPILMIDRPPLESGPVTADPSGIEGWIGGQGVAQE